MSARNVKVVPFRFWWCVEWEEDDGEYFLLFRRRDKADNYKELLVSGKDKDTLWEAAIRRLER